MAPSDSEPGLPPPGPGPVAGDARLEDLDILRGFALLGVLLMNLHFWFRGPVERYALAAHPFPGAANAVTDLLTMVVFNEKSVTLFAFLFGAGLTMQLERAQARGRAFGPYAARRLSALLAFGLLHVALLWVGDILYYYAICGALLLPFLRRSAASTLRWGLVLTFLPLAAGLLLAQAPSPSDLAAWRTEMAAAAQASLQAYGQGSWAAAAGFRIHQFLRTAGELAGFVPYTLGLFLLGSAAWKRGVLREPGAHLRLLRGLVVGGALALAATAGLTAWALARGRFGQLYLGGGPAFLMLLVTPPLALGYAAGLLLLLRRPGARRWLRILAPMGRMALTNYLLQSLAMTWFFNGYGLGLYGKIGPFAGTLLLGGAFYLLQIAVSAWWLARFRFGPLEWIWRCLTYAARQPFRAA